jgi:thiamine biosynthesis protein ThiI
VTGESDRAVLVGYGEIGSKSRRVRARMAETLRENLGAVLADRGVDAAVERTWSRLVVRADDVAAAAEAAADTFGVVWARPALVVDPTVEAVRDALASVAEGDTGTFAVRASRAGDHPFRSGDLERAGGAAVAATGREVDLDDPDRVYRVDCRREAAYVSGHQHGGPGGLPLGTQGRAVALVSGGLDSPVAAYETMRRGCEVLPVYVSLGDYGGPDHEARAVETVRRLARYAPDRDLRVRVVDGGAVVESVVETLGPTRMLSLRRAMLAMAAEVADGAGAHSIVTGEMLGQKSSQTGANLAATDAAVDLPVHRPLLARDKSAVVARAREIGTFEGATLPVGCDRVAPTHPETVATPESVRAAEPADLLDRARAAARNVRLVDLDGDLGGD